MKQIKAKKIAIAIFVIFSLILLNLLSLASALTVDSISIFPEEIEPGKTAEIRLVLENNLNNDVENVQIFVDLTDMPFTSISNEASVSEIREDKSKTFEFDITALINANSEIYKIPVTITYLDESQEKKKSVLVSLTVNSKPLLDLEADDSLLLRGQKNEFTVKIINKGLSDVRFLEAEIGTGTSYKLLSTNKLYVGDIDSDDFETAEFSLFLKENALSTISVPVTLTYKDITNKEYTEEFSLILRTYSKDEAIKFGLISKSNLGTIIGVIVLLVVIYIIYRIIKARRRAKLRKQ